MFIQQARRWALTAVVAGSLVGSVAVADETSPGSWQQHQYTFNFFGFTTTYSCQGLEDKLTELLRMSGAAPDMKVNSPCNRGFGVPDKLALAYLTFSSLQPTTVQQTSTNSGTAGEWRHVVLSPRHPYHFDYGDCELIEQFRDKVLPLFVTRNITNHVTCVPHQDSGSNFYLSYDVFAPPAAPRKP